MKKVMNSKMKSEELKTQELLEKTNKQDYLIERIDIEDSPFTIVGNKEMGYMGTMGKWKITEIYKTKEEAKETTEKPSWNRMVQVMLLIKEL